MIAAIYTRKSKRGESHGRSDRSASRKSGPGGKKVKRRPAWGYTLQVEAASRSA